MCHLEKASQQLQQQKISYLWWRCIHVVYTETNQSLSVWMHTEYKVEKNSKSKRKQTKKESIICRYEMPGNTRYLEFNCCGGNCMSVWEKRINERRNKRMSGWMNESGGVMNYHWKWTFNRLNSLVSPPVSIFRHQFPAFRLWPLISIESIFNLSMCHFYL